MGAGRTTLVRALLVESLLLGLAGGAAGLVLAYWATSAIAALDPSIGVPLLNQTRLDYGGDRIRARASRCWRRWCSARCRRGRPASHWRRCDADSRGRRQHHERSETAAHAQPVDRRGDDARGRAARRRRPAGAQLRAAAVGRSWLHPRMRCRPSTSPLPDARYAQPLQRQAFVETLLARAATVPNVESAGAVFGLPLSSFQFGISTSTRDGVTLSDDEQDALTLQVRLVTPDYFRTMGIPIVKGRGFTAGDRIGAQAGRDAEPDRCGARVAGSGCARASPADRHTVRHGRRARRRHRDRHRRRRARLRSGSAGRRRRCICRTRSGRTAASASSRRRATAIRPRSCSRLRALLQELDADVPMSAVRSMEQLSSAAVAQPRLYLVLIASFAGTAMLLAAIGLYGVLAYAVGQRTREIGIRLALGAKRGEVLRMVMIAGGQTRHCGRGDWARRGGHRQPRVAIATLPDRADRYAHLCPGRRRPADRRARRQLDSGAARIAN